MYVNGVRVRDDLKISFDVFLTKREVYCSNKEDDEQSSLTRGSLESGRKRRGREEGVTVLFCIVFGSSASPVSNCAICGAPPRCGVVKKSPGIMAKRGKGPGEERGGEGGGQTHKRD